MGRVAVVYVPATGPPPASLADPRSSVPDARRVEVRIYYEGAPARHGGTVLQVPRP